MNIDLRDKNHKSLIVNHKSTPIQYQRGWTEFYKLKFYLTPDVLIPRPETETLVDEVLGIITKLSSSDLIRGSIKIPDQVGNDKVAILDLGTGSGCIAISIAKNLPNSKILATDVSSKALKVSEKNAKFHKVEDRIILIKSDLLEFVKDRHSGVIQNPSLIDSGVAYAPQNDTTALDIIVANLPYISSARLMLVDPMVLDFEPRLALDGGRDGFELYRKLFSQIKNKNFFPKYLVAEIDDDQGDLAILEVKKYFPQAEVEIKKDLSRMDRILIIKF